MHLTHPSGMRVRHAYRQIKIDFLSRVLCRGIKRYTVNYRILVALDLFIQ